MTSLPPPAAADVRRLVNIVAIVAFLDFLLLIPLVYASLSNNHELVSILGPAHGVGFLIELGLTLRGLQQRMWGWWFPVIVVITAGPLGALIGHRKVTRQL